MIVTGICLQHFMNYLFLFLTYMLMRKILLKIQALNWGLLTGQKAEVPALLLTMLNLEKTKPG